MKNIRREFMSYRYQLNLPAWGFKFDSPTALSGYDKTFKLSSHDAYAKDKLTTPELHEFVKLEKLRGSEGLNSLQVEEYRRFATPIAVMILTLIGAVVASRKVRGGSGAHIAMGIILAATFILMDRFSTIFSTKGDLPPLIAAWIPDIVFTFVAIYVYRKAPK